MWEQLANSPGTGAALTILCAAMPERRGGGDFDLDENWHGPERVDMTGPGEMPEAYSEIAARTIGRWAGKRVALIGDYAEDSDLPDSPIPASKIYELCDDEAEGCFADITADVAAVIEHELQGKFVGEGWKDWVKN